ncbi:MAG: septum formation protein Maf [Candidatus Omnitrophica bacterium CG22_combo_CG10-13_8_21_14_all_43_16]|nr:MAG: septum formation protein Maf [Candidatus Omnitrophica bacterium CG22_combo_CG10-13_8_21_14_all_43_16]
MNIILASGSKRRREILASCGIKHKVVPSNAVEYMTISRLPEQVAMINARIKAEAVAKKFKSGYVIGADTVVLLGKKIIGKPKNASHAKKMLKEMSGKTISVYTGLCVVDVEEESIISDYEKSLVTVKKLKTREIPAYFKLLGPYDKAGGFSIEGAGSFIFDDIKGSYFNVLGLPTARLKEMFEKLGVSILKEIGA